MKRAKQKGITLIALVITIVVLLILAAVSIATLTGQNGILTRANDAKEDTARETAKEKENEYEKRCGPAFVRRLSDTVRRLRKKRRIIRLSR